jgi:hypothetical protein
MRLSAIHLSRVTFLVEIVDLDPQGKLFFPDFFPSLAAACEFRVFPETVAKYKDGAVFETGKWGDQRIDKLTIFRDGISIETASPTAATEVVLEELLLWAKTEHGINYEPGIIKRKIYASSVAVFFDIQLDSLHPIFTNIAKTLSESATKNLNQPIVFRTSAITLSTNTLATKFAPGMFTIERRIDVPDSENKYFSVAPLATDEHLAILEQFEESLKKK